MTTPRERWGVFRQARPRARWRLVWLEDMRNGAEAILVEWRRMRRRGVEGREVHQGYRTMFLKVRSVP